MVNYKGSNYGPKLGTQWSKGKREVVEWNGFFWYRYLDRPNRHQYFYHDNKPLHKAIWESINGEVPEGHIIHHKDNNPANNELSNLELLTIGEHSRLHLIGRKRNWHGYLI